MMTSACAYKNCSSISEPFSELAFFGLPKDEEYRRIWIRYAGNSQLSMTSIHTKKLFCEKHFHEKYLRRQFNRTTLTKDAIPFNYKDCEQCEEQISNDISLEVPSNENEDLEGYEEVGEVYYLQPNADLEESAGEEIVVDVPYSKNDVCDQSERVIILNQEYIPEEKNVNIIKSFDTCYESKIKNGNVTGNSRTIHNETHFYEYDSNASDSTVSKRELSDSDGEVHIIEMEHSSNSQSSEYHIVNALSTKSSVKRKKTEKIDDITEDTKFALSLVDILQRIHPRKKAKAKIRVLNYLTDIQYSGEVI